MGLPVENCLCFDCSMNPSSILKVVEKIGVIQQASSQGHYNCSFNEAIALSTSTFMSIDFNVCCSAFAVAMLISFLNTLFLSWLSALFSFATLASFPFTLGQIVFLHHDMCKAVIDIVL